MRTSCPERKEVPSGTGQKYTESQPNIGHTPERSFFSGVMVLTVSGLLVKALGMFFKIPMNYFVGDTGMGYYNAAYTLYTFFYTISTAGLPTAVSVMTAAAHGAGRKKQCRRILGIALGLFCGIGLAGTVLFSLLPEALAAWIGAPPAYLAILTIAPTLIFVCVASAMRGYFQGLSRMVPTAVSQFLEALCKVAAGILGAVYALRQNAPPHVVAAYAILGLTLGSAVSMLYLLAVGLFTGKTPEIGDTGCAGTGKLLGELASIAVPVTLSSAVMSLSSVIDTVLLQRLLQNTGMTQEAATTLYGNYTSLAVPMFNLPPVLVYPIAYALVPLLTGFRSMGESGVPLRNQRISSAIRIAVLIGAPCAAGMAALAEPVLKLLYRSASAETAAPLLAILAPASLPVCLLAITNSVLQSIGKASLPVYSMLAGSAVKITVTALFVPGIGIYAAPIGTFLCYLTASAMNLYFLCRETGVQVVPGHMFGKPLLAAGVCAGSAVLVCRMLQLMMPEKLTVIPSVMVAAAVYLLFVKKLRILQETDLLLLPKPETLRKWLGYL